MAVWAVKHCECLFLGLCSLTPTELLPPLTVQLKMVEVSLAQKGGLAAGMANSRSQDGTKAIFHFFCFWILLQGLLDQLLLDLTPTHSPLGPLWVS